jgi:hypothetical protein
MPVNRLTRGPPPGRDNPPERAAPDGPLAGSASTSLSTCIGFWGAVMMIPSPDPLCVLALGLTALLALRADPPQVAWRGARLPAWVAPAVLAAFAVGSGVLGVIDPESLAVTLGAS